MFYYLLFLSLIINVFISKEAQHAMVIFLSLENWFPTSFVNYKAGPFRVQIAVQCYNVV